MPWGNSLERWGRFNWGIDGVAENYFNIKTPKIVFKLETLSTSGIFNLNVPKIAFVLNRAGRFELTIPPIRLNLVDARVSIGHFELVVPKNKFKLYQAKTASGSFNLTVPKIRLDFFGASETKGSFSLIIPKNIFKLYQSQEAYILIINTDTGVGPTTYTDWDWNSAIQVGDDIFVCDTSGLYRVTGILDKGSTAIDATFTIPETDGGKGELKTYHDMFVSFKGGPIDVQTFSDSTYNTSYRLLNTDDKLKTKRAPLALGVEERYTGIKITNVDGSTFDIDAVELIGLLHSRKIKR